MKSFFQRREKDKGKKGSAGRSSGAAARKEREAREAAPSIDDLVILGRLDEAEEQLRSRLKSAPGDQHARMKLAEVLQKQQRGEEAVEEYLGAADQLLRDGFLDRAHAILLRAQRLSPINDAITQRFTYLEERRSLDKIREQAVAALSSASRTATGTIATAAIELEQIWDRLSRTDFVRFLPGEQIAKVLSNMRLRRFGEGDVLIRDGAEEALILLVTFGEVEALVPASAAGTSTSLRTFSIGELLGESTLLEHKTWPVTLRAAKSGSALVLERSGLEACLVGNPDPRGLLQGLRRQGNDAQLREMRGKLVSS